MANVVGKAALRRPLSIATEEVDCPELGGTVIVRRLTATEAAAIALEGQETVADGNNPVKAVDMLIALVRFGWVDGEGLQVVTTDEDEAALRQWPMELLTKVSDAVGRVSGLSKDAASDAEKNS